MKQQRANSKRSKIQQKDDFQKYLSSSTGMSNGDNDFNIDKEAIKKIYGEDWYEIFHWNELHPDEQVNNIIMITAKSVRKTKLVKFKEHTMLAEHKWLEAYDLRRTKDQSMNALVKEHMDTLNLWANEYDTPWMRDVITKASNKMYFVRDKKRKDNQEINFSSFEAMASLGGFTRPNIFHWEELVDPDSKGKAPSKEEFLYVYDLVNSKNKENFLAFGKNVKDIGASHYFTMNRWDDNHPLIEFAEEVAPWVPVKEWMMEDLEKNNIFAKYVDKAPEGWEELNRSLIVYASKFSNSLLSKNEEWKQKQLDLVATGSQKQLGMVLGDTFEGDFNANKTYSFKEFYTHKSLPKTPNRLSIGIDKDKNEEIVLTPKYLLKFDDYKTQLKYRKTVYASIRGKQVVLPANKKTWNGEVYYNLTKQKILEMVKVNIREIKEVIVYLDDDQKLWIDRFNLDEDMRRERISFVLAKKHGLWGIRERTDYMEQEIPRGFESSLDGNLYLLAEYTRCNNSDSTNMRDEKKGRNKLNKINSDEYSSYVNSFYKNSFPTGFWKWWYNKDK